MTDALLEYETIAHDSTSSESNHQRQSGCEINPWKQGLELYDQLRPSLLAYLHNLGLSRENGEDVLQETFVRLVEHIRSKTADDNLRGWIYRVAYNLSMDIHRMERRYPPCSLDWMVALEPSCREPVDPAPGPEERVIQGEDSRRLKSAVLTLTLQQRNCVLLRAKGLRYTEIAATLGISEQRARILQKRGTTLIAAWL